MGIKEKAVVGIFDLELDVYSFNQVSNMVGETIFK